jgi:phosphoglycolate phosphatase-like HAD superfamily hydrolase
LANLLSENPRKNRDWVDRFYKGDIGGGNIIKQIFQEVYLGESLFKRVYGGAPRVHRGSGMIARETLIPEKPLLEQLSEKYLLAVATGRPAFEADYALTAFGIRRLFAIVLSHDDCVAEERRRGAEDGHAVSLLKPDPYMLDSIASRVGEEIGCRYYVGDLPDDMLAAARAKSGYIGIGFAPDAESDDQRRRELFDAGAHCVIGDLSRLAETVEETKERKE